MNTSHFVIRDRGITVDSSGDGAGLLLLHGFPETRATWRSVAPELTDRYHVVCPDLPGYGGSERLSDGPDGFDKGRLAEHMIALMNSFGHDTFAVVGHDRGGLVAFRAALDHPDVVTHLGVLDILPTVDNWTALQGPAGVFAFHLYLMAQPDDFPERLIAAAPDIFFGHFLDTWTKVPDAIPADQRQHYLSILRSPTVIHAICDDYRASAFIDLGADRRDQDAGRKLSMPVLAAWQDPGDSVLPFDPEQIWATWAADLTTLSMQCGHFLPEEQPLLVAAAIRDLLA